MTNRLNGIARPSSGLLLPDGTPATRSMEPGQVAAVRAVQGIAMFPDLAQTLTDIAQWRESNKGPLSKGQRDTIRCVQTVARWRDEARAIMGLDEPEGE
jgi:hypothetical protein